MMRRNNQTNSVIMWMVIVGDFVLLNALLAGYGLSHDSIAARGNLRLFFILNNVALLFSEWKFHTIIHERLSSAGGILKRILELTLTQVVVAYVLLHHMMFWTATGRMLLEIGAGFFVLLVVIRLLERLLVKRLRRMGRNTRTVTMVGSDAELRRVYEELVNDPATGYRITGYYADQSLEDGRAAWLGTIGELMARIESGKRVGLGDELYVCLSRREKDTIRKLSNLCDREVTKFYYIPVSVESIGLNMTREYINDIEVYTTHENPLENPVNRMLKRMFDVVLSIAFLIPTAIVFPVVWIVIKMQSPGPIFFRQERTGLDGKNFKMLKFRSMHVNTDADRVQATKDDPRKFPFGSFMRKSNIDELPQFWNVLTGSMSIVGPRPHMLAHTEMYSRLIDQYMVRHFVKPGVTGWAQVTGFRGETKELWQMEGRVKRDIWYMEHWTIWLDIRIVWLTIKNIFVHDEHAY